MRRSWLLLVVASGCAALVAAPSATAAPTPSTSVTIAFSLPTTETGFWLNSAADCLIPTSGWSIDSTRHFEGRTIRPRGLLDVGGHSGEAIVPGEAIHVDRIFGPRPKAIAAADVGLQLAGRDAYLTGVMRSSRSFSAKRPARRRLARMRGVKTSWTTKGGQLIVTVRGKATMLAPLANALERLRCKGPREGGRPITVGTPLGAVTATITPASARALSGLLVTELSLFSDTVEVPTVAPLGSTRLSGGALHFAWTASGDVPATCAPACVPSGGTVRLDGGFELVQGATRLPFTELELTADGERLTLTAMVGGVRRVVVSPETQGALSADVRMLIAGTFADVALDGRMAVPDITATNLAPS